MAVVNDTLTRSSEAAAYTARMQIYLVALQETSIAIPDLWEFVFALEERLYFLLQ